jgi:hypothetical protein
MAALLAGSVCLVAAVAQRATPTPAAPDAPRSIVSFFALGDTGAERSWSWAQRNVAEALTRLDRRRPADALLLLGDNFYPEGLARSEAVDRLLRNVIEPYCAFVRLTQRWEGPRPSCLEDGRERPPRRIWSVLGNHDHEREESPALQRAWIPDRLATWTMPPGDVGVYELAGGVSLVLYDSTVLMQEPRHLPELTEALRSSRGPWRILVGHHPLRLDWNGPQVRASAARLRRAVTDAGVPVQLVLSGHEHSLQVIDLEESKLGLQVIAGSGSRLRRVRGRVPDRLEAEERFGFARVDLLDAPQPRLEVTLYQLSSWLPDSWVRPWPVSAKEFAVFDVDAAGRFRAGRSGPFAGTPASPR